MSRSLPSDFVVQCEADYSRPYFILGINWGTSVEPIWRYYMDRDTTSFVASGDRRPASGLITKAFVIDWGENPMRIREQQVNSVEGRTIKLEDTEGHIRAMFASTVRQQKGVIIYRMFDADDVTWPGDAVPVFAGSVLPMNWSETDCIVTLQFEDAARRFFPDVAIYATQSIFGSEMVPESRDKMMPIPWGKVHRMKALRVLGPWENKTRTSFVADTGDVTIDVDYHPSEIGITSLGTSSHPIPVFIGPDLVQGYFVESSSPDDTPSTFTIKSGAGITLASAVIEMVVGTGTRDAYIRATSIRPDNQQTTLLDAVEVGDPVRVFIFDPTNNWVDTTITVLEREDPWPNWYRIRFASTTVQRDMAPGAPIHFISPDVDRRGWQAGVTMQPKVANSVYIASAFPSKGVLLVEGYGKVWDMNGESRQDFVKLGKSFNEGLVDTVPFEEADYDAYIVNRDDDTWFTELGHNVTTITMAMLPRGMNPDLDTNDIWLTMLGITEDFVLLNDEIRNPALVILQYLECEWLLNLAAENIDYPSFTAAATLLDGYFVGWAQTKPMKGIEILQEIARQCHSIILLDGDAVQIVVLQNYSTTAALTFDTGSNQSPAGDFDNIKAGSLELGESSIVDIVTNMVGKWTKYRDEYSGKDGYNIQAINTGALALFQRKDREFPIDLYWRRDDAALEVEFWLTRESRIYGLVKFVGYHDALKLLPGDWIKITYWAGSAGAIDTGTDLKTESIKRVSAVSHTFTGDDVGRKLVITGPTGAIKSKFTVTITAAPGTYSYGPIGNTLLCTMISNSFGFISAFGIGPGYSLIAGGIGFNFCTFEEDVAGSGAPQYAEDPGATAGNGTLVIDVDGSETGWDTGDYTILSVASGIATLDRNLASHPLSAGVFSIRESTDVVLQDKFCEVTAVTDKGPDGEVAIECRYPKFTF